VRACAPATRPARAAAHAPDHLVDKFLVADCGFDPFVGFFVDVFDVRGIKPKLVYDHEGPLLGALNFLEHHGLTVFFEDALTALPEPEHEDLPSGVARTVKTVMEFKAAAD
jgi:hypothetical protein